MKAELYILGILHRGDFHPYEVKRRLTQAMIECFTDVDVGTLYYAVRQLAECGLLTAVAHQRVARGGMRTVYRITPRGRDRFRELLHAQFAAEGDLRETLYGPMLFLHLADLNLVDYQQLQVSNPWVEADLPAGGRRLLQDATGYVATIKSGTVTFADGKDTGERPGSLIRGAR